MYFFVHFLKSGGEGRRDIAAADAYVRNFLFLVEYNGNYQFPEKKEKKTTKKYMNIFFFLSNTFQCDL